MHNSFSSFSRRLMFTVLSATLSTTGALLFLSTTPVAAQSSASQLDTTQSGDGGSNGSFSNSDASMTNMFNLFHQLNMGGVQSSSDFRRSQQESIGNEAANFRTRQLELLRQQRQQPTSPAVEPIEETTTPVTPVTPNN